MKRKTKSKIAALLVICMCFPMSATARYTDRETFTNSSKAGNFIGELDVSKETELLNSSTNDISIYSISDTADENSILIENYTSNDFVFVDEDTGIEYTDKIATNSNAKYNKIASPSNAYMIDTYDLTDDIDTYSNIYPVEINSDNFPDTVLLNKAEDADTDNDGFLSESEAEDYDVMLCYGLTNLDGIEYFKVKELTIRRTTITDLVFPELDSLEWLFIEDVGLETLDISNLHNLTSLQVPNNNLKEIDISNNTNLKDLICNDNELLELDVSGLSNLQNLYCQNNNIETLILNNVPSLQYLYCYDNNLESIDLSDTSGLQYLYCYNNKLKELDLSNCSYLFSIRSYDNDIYKVILPNNGYSINIVNLDRDSDNWYTSLYMDSGTQITETSISAVGQTIYHSETISLPFIFSMKNTGTCDGYFKTVFNLSTDDREQGFKTISFYKLDSTENVDWFNFDTTGLTPYYTTTAEDGQYYYALNDFGHGINSVGANLPVKIEAGNEEEYIYVIVLQAIPGNEFNLNIEAEFSAGTYSRSFQLYPNSGFTYNESKKIIDNFPVK